MSVRFQITWTIEPAAAMYPVEEEIVDASELFIHFRRFLAHHRGEFTLRFGVVELKFNFTPDLSTVFEELPWLLESLENDTGEPIDLHFFEQGTDLALSLERHGESVTVRIRKGPAASKRFPRTPEEPVSVRARDFLGEWCRFLQQILDELARFEAQVQATACYRSYSARLARVREKLVLDVPTVARAGALSRAPAPQRRFVAVTGVLAAQGIES